MRAFFSGWLNGVSIMQRVFCNGVCLRLRSKLRAKNMQIVIFR